MIVIVRERPEHRAQVLEFIGKIDSQSCPDLDQALEELLGHTSVRIVIDLTRVSHMGSQAVGILVRHFMQTAQRRGTQIRLAGMNVMVEQLLRVSGVDRVMPLFASLDAALADFSVTA